MEIPINTLNKDNVDKTNLELERDSLIEQFKSIEDEINNIDKGIFEEFINRFEYSKIKVTRTKEYRSYTTSVIGKEKGKGIYPELQELINQIVDDRIKKLDNQYVKLRVIQMVSSELLSEKHDEIISKNFNSLYNLIMEKRTMIFQLKKVEF